MSGASQKYLSRVVDSEQDIHAVFDSSESDDESEYPLGYYDESDDDWEETGGRLASPTFSSSQLEQQPALDTGFQGDYYGGVLEASEAEFFPQQDISTGSASTFVEGAAPADGNYDNYSYTHEHSDREEHDSGGACEEDVDHSDFDSGDRYDSGSGGAGSGSYDGYSSRSS
ncbi:hypothetical protein CYMTET_39657 [Cymbomonas tetramitiformis]|uniref:Uncharacterized protein n=1 Tax=Cymbomonas tetramitiformis TaxID=36881 RepID=A0AAE0C9N9_9CHLO|nr:hypothetical protein CYMTET_39657 [Cymbomonas tetramitiformis]